MHAMPKQVQPGISDSDIRLFLLCRVSSVLELPDVTVALVSESPFIECRLRADSWYRLGDMFKSIVLIHLNAKTQSTYIHFLPFLYRIGGLVVKLAVAI
jgi:hypothetical protein